MKLDRTQRKSLVLVGVSLLVTVAVFSYLFSFITWGQVAELIVSIDRRLLALFFAISFSMLLVRTMRYRVILKSVGAYPGFLRLFLVVLVRGFCVDLLPARTGELVYIYLLRVKLKVELGAATASFALAFLFDMMALAPMIVLALFLVGAGLSLSWPVLAGAGVALFGFSALLIHILIPGLRLAFGWSARLPDRWRKLRRWVRRFIAATHRQVFRARARGVYVPVFGWSVAVRLLKYGGLYVLLLAMLVPQGYTLPDLPFPKVFLGFCAAEMAASLPISGIGGFGAYQGAWSLVFILLGFPAEMAKTTSVSHHVFSQMYGYAIGLIGLLAILMVSARKPTR
ncbi:MAG TPA: lysylphosphatidylglycerol synthase transmembrane domain-containing protein [Kiritimatiellia bacterium]|nr:lysylphosphatidylglycerol synthase transmembrane domain-containing protein [Kiritimatiellia bacterium]HMO97560.1 lysylphosphatidylglycerol synthase transmembrane domain-containing protein [Kiritimatiellia bacterium]HMP95954.1 lysylphosphatidylglycerol synthase transmembrane domain-containing protein [Kiritimatiellia bacterium]